MIKKFAPLPVPRGQGGEFTFEGVVVVGDIPYCIFIERQTDQRNNWVHSVHLSLFVEEKKP